MNLAEERKGEIRTMQCGLKAEIVVYRRADDIDVLFEDNVLVTHKCYKHFITGKIGHGDKRESLKEERKGERRMMNCGQIAEIIDYRASCDIDIQFEDGTIVENKKYRNFMKGEIAYPKDSRVEEERMMKCGLKAKIAHYYSARNITVEFENGTIVHNKSYSNFVKGLISDRVDKSYTERKGEQQLQQNGHIATIIEYRNCMDIDVKLDNGHVIKNIQYHVFKSGKIIDKQLKKTNIMNNGMKAKIINYRTSKDIDIQFEDNTIVYNKSYYDFLKGSIGHPIKSISGISYNEIIVSHYLSKMGFKKYPKGSLKDLGFGNMELDLYNPDMKIAIEYDGGFNHSKERDKQKNEICKKNKIHLIRIREPQLEKYKYPNLKIFYLTSSERASESLEQTIISVISYINTLNHSNQNIEVNLKKDADIFYKIYSNFNLPNKRIQETKMMNCGKRATIIAYRSCKDIDVQFEDEVIAYNKEYNAFKKGSIGYPKKEA